MSEETKNKQAKEKTQNQENKESPIYIMDYLLFFLFY